MSERSVVSVDHPGRELLRRAPLQTLRASSYQESWMNCYFNHSNLPREIGDAVAFLASDKASYITGETIYVDGGGLDMNDTC